MKKSTRITVQNSVVMIGGLMVATYAIAALFIANLRTPVFESLLTKIPWSAYCHIVPGALALVLGAFLLSRRIRRTKLWLHKRLGYAYVVCVLASTVGALVGNYASPSSTGAKLGFLILGIIWPMVTLVGTPFDDMFDRRAHGTMMKISYALTFAAVTLRIYLAALLTLGFDFETAFAISAWASWMVNLAFLFIYWRIEAWIRKRALAKSMPS